MNECQNSIYKSIPELETNMYLISLSHDLLFVLKQIILQVRVRNAQI